MLYLRSNVNNITRVQLSCRLTPFLIPALAICTKKYLSALVVDMPVISALWLKGNVENAYALDIQLFKIAVTDKILSKVHIWLGKPGGPVSKRKCPIDGKKVKSCIHCKVCSIMHGFGGAGGMSDGKYNITNNFGGDLYTFTGKEKAIELMQYVDKINLEMGGQDAKLYSTTSSDIKAMALKYDLHLLDAMTLSRTR